MYLVNINRLPTCFRFGAKGWGIARREPGSVSGWRQGKSSRQGTVTAWS